MDLPVDLDEDKRKPLKRLRPKRYECLHCFRVFASNYHLRRHSVVHSTEKRNFNCQFCELTFRLHKELLMHEATHKRTLADIHIIRCKTCGVTCDDLKVHLKECHEYLECDICNGLYGTKGHLKVHMKIHINAREHKCSLCPKRYNFASEVKRHERSHSTVKAWFCEICGIAFKTKGNLSAHTRSHNGEKPYQCDRCDRSFSSRQSLYLHLRIHDQIKPYKCPWAECGRAFYDITTMKVHTRLHTNENPYICHLCGKTTKQASNLKSHYVHGHKIKDITSKMIRANARLFQKYKMENLPEAGLLEILSQQVQQNFANQQAANVTSTINAIRTDHTTNHSEIAQRGSNEVNVVTVPVTAIKMEASGDCRLQEVIKKENFNSLDAIPLQQIKVEKEHSPLQQMKQTKIEKVFIDEGHQLEIDAKDSVVKEEDAAFYEFQITELNDSLRDPISSASLDGKPSSSFQSTEKVEFKCGSCPSTFLQKRSLKCHSLRMHTDAKKSICEICGKTFKENWALTKHIRTHSNSRPFSCETCGSSFKSASGLKVHIRSHSGEKPYTCSFCSKTFSTSMGRNLHQRSHTGEKPYKCTFCESAFSDNSTWKQHLRTHTGEKPYVCHLCGRGTTQAGNLKSHLRHAHKLQVKNVSMKRNVNLE